MKKNLPYLNQERLDNIFNGVYGFIEADDEDMPFEDEKMNRFFKMLKVMQEFNYWHRQSDVHPLFGLLNPDFNFERNSDGTTLWLALILAIQELYGFSDKKLVSVMKQVTVRH